MMSRLQSVAHPVQRDRQCSDPCRRGTVQEQFKGLQALMVSSPADQRSRVSLDAP